MTGPADEVALRPPGSEVHLWLAELDGDWPDAAGLPREERVRAAAILAPQRRRRWVASRWALRRTLARYLGGDPTRVELRAGPGGKPRLASPSCLRFNLSHSAGLAAIAVAHRREVGVDLERIDRRRDVLRIARRWLQPSVADALGASPPAERVERFYDAWTRQEALGKCHGLGPAAAPPPTPVAVTHLVLRRGFAGALAVAGEELPRLRRFLT